MGAKFSWYLSSLFFGQYLTVWATFPVAPQIGQVYFISTGHLEKMAIQHFFLFCCCAMFIVRNVPDQTPVVFEGVRHVELLVLSVVLAKDAKVVLWPLVAASHRRQAQPLRGQHPAAAKLLALFESRLCC